MSQSILINEFDVEKILYSEVKVLKNGGKTVYVNYEAGNRKCILQTPLMHLPYGVGLFEGGDGDAQVKKYDLNLSFKGMESNPRLATFFEKMQAMEKKIVKDALVNSLTWFKKKYTSEDVVAALFTPMIKHDTDKDTGEVLNRYPSTLKVKVPYNVNNDTFTFPCCDMDQNEVEFANIKDKLKGGKARLLIQMAGLWFAGGKFGCTWKIYQGMFETANARSGAYTFRKEADEDEEEEHDEDLAEEAAAAVSNVKVASKGSKPAAAAPAQLPESDEEEEEEDAEEEEDVDSEVEDLPPPPVKKAAAKKTTTVKK